MILEMLVLLSAQVFHLLIISFAAMRRLYLCLVGSHFTLSLWSHSFITKKNNLLFVSSTTKQSWYKDLLNPCCLIRPVNITSLWSNSNKHRANRQSNWSQRVQAINMFPLFSNLYVCPGLTGWRWGDGIKYCLPKRWSHSVSQFQEGL